jgi:hypothetical protein
MNSSLLWEFNIDDVYALKKKLERIIVLKIKWLKTRISLLFIYLFMVIENSNGRQQVSICINEKKKTQRDPGRQHKKT